MWTKCIYCVEFVGTDTKKKRKQNKNGSIRLWPHAIALEFVVLYRPWALYPLCWCKRYTCRFICYGKELKWNDFFAYSTVVFWIFVSIKNRAKFDISFGRVMLVHDREPFSSLVVKNITLSKYQSRQSQRRERIFFWRIYRCAFAFVSPYVNHILLNSDKLFIIDIFQCACVLAYRVCE